MFNLLRLFSSSLAYSRAFQILSFVIPLESHPFAKARSNSRRPCRVTSPYLDPGAVGHHRVVVVVTAVAPMPGGLLLSPSTAALLFRAK